VDFSRPGVSASKLQDTAKSALPRRSNRRSNVFGEVYSGTGPRIPAFSGNQQKKPIAPDGCKSCYRGPGTSFLGACLPSPPPFGARSGPLEVHRAEIDGVPEHSASTVPKWLVGPIWGGFRNFVAS